jgi:hypothetical protein
MQYPNMQICKDKGNCLLYIQLCLKLVSNLLLGGTFNFWGVGLPCLNASCSPSPYPELQKPEGSNNRTVLLIYVVYKKYAHN